MQVTVEHTTQGTSDMMKSLHHWRHRIYQQILGETPTCMEHSGVLPECSIQGGVPPRICWCWWSFDNLSLNQLRKEEEGNNRADYSAPLNIFHVRKCPAETNKTTTMTLICRTSWRILSRASLWSTELFIRMNCPPYISKSWAFLKKSVILWVWYALWREQEYSRDEEIPPPGRGRFPRCLRRRRWLYVANRIAPMGRIRGLLLLDCVHVKKRLNTNGDVEGPSIVF